jgi:hypothetical protein
MNQQGIGNVVGTTTGEVLKKVKEAGPDTERKKKAAGEKDTISISPEARELMSSEPGADQEEAMEADPTG